MEHHQRGAAAQGMMDLQVWLEGSPSSCEQKVLEGPELN